jgi:uroporphyrinogen-III synthase
MQRVSDGADLGGYTIGITAERRAEDQAVMWRRRGADVLHGPTIQTNPVTDSDGLRERTEEVIDRPPDFLVANTGLGIRTWFEHAERWGRADQLRAALAGTRIAARGPKAAGAVAIAGLEVWWRSPTEQVADVIDRLVEAGVGGTRVAYQLHGADVQGFPGTLRQAGANVIEIPVYHWVLPADAHQATHLIEQCCRGAVDAVTFTAGPQVRNMLELADAHGLAGTLLDAFNGAIVVGCVGPVCAGVAHEEGIRSPVVPEHWRLGSLVKSVADALLARGPGEPGG